MEDNATPSPPSTTHRSLRPALLSLRSSAHQCVLLFLASPALRAKPWGRQPRRARTMLPRPQPTVTHGDCRVPEQLRRGTWQALPVGGSGRDKQERAAEPRGSSPVSLRSGQRGCPCCGQPEGTEPGCLASRPGQYWLSTRTGPEKHRSPRGATALAGLPQLARRLCAPHRGRRPAVSPHG